MKQKGRRVKTPRKAATQPTIVRPL